MSAITIDQLPTYGGILDADVYTLVRAGGATYKVPSNSFGGSSPSGAGVPTGGTTGQVLVKTSDVDYETDWTSLDKNSVGLGNVDNTSNATERAATATLTNKTLTTPVINGFTGGTQAINIGSGQIVKDTSGNVGVGTATPSAHDGRLAVLGNISMINAGSKLHLYYIASTNRAWVGSETGGEITLGTGLSAPTERMRIATDGTTTFISAAFGYGTGAGGTVTQVTSKGTGVTLNKPSGQITMHNAALSAGALVSFDITNSFVTINDTVLVSMIGAVFTHSNYRVWVGNAQAGKFTVFVENRSAGSLSEAVVFNFAIIKAATA